LEHRRLDGACFDPAAWHHRHSGPAIPR